MLDRSNRDWKASSCPISRWASISAGVGSSGPSGRSAAMRRPVRGIAGRWRRGWRWKGGIVAHCDRHGRSVDGESSDSSGPGPAAPARPGRKAMSSGATFIEGQIAAFDRRGHPRRPRSVGRQVSELRGQSPAARLPQGRHLVGNQRQQRRTTKAPFPGRTMAAESGLSRGDFPPPFGSARRALLPAITGRDTPLRPPEGIVSRRRS